MARCRLLLQPKHFPGQAVDMNRIIASGLVIAATALSTSACSNSDLSARIEALEARVADIDANTARIEEIAADMETDAEVDEVRFNLNLGAIGELRERLDGLIDDIEFDVENLRVCAADMVKHLNSDQKEFFISTFCPIPVLD